MSDFDFLKEFAKNIDREKALEPSDEDCEKLAATLHAQERRKHRRSLMLAWVFPLAASVVFVLLSTMLWKTRSRADRMFTEITRLQTELGSKNSILMTDTTMRHVLVIEYDTIYRTVVMQTLVHGSAAQIFSHKVVRQGDSIFQKNQDRNIVINKQQKTEDNAPFQNTSPRVNTAAEFAERNRDTTLQKSKVSIFAAGVRNPSDSLTATRKGQANLLKIQTGATASDLPRKEDSLAMKSDLPILPLKGILPPKSRNRKPLPNTFDMMVALPASSPPHVPMIRRFRPHDAMVGITGGILFPQTQGATPLNNFIVGLNGQMTFGRHLRLLAGAEYGSTNFKVNGSALDNSNIPILLPPSPNDMLEYVQVKQPLRDFSLGLRYVFAPQKRLRPFLGVAWVGEQSLEQTLKYEFRNQLTDEETYTLVPRNNAHFSAKGLQIGLGAEWAFTKRLSFVLEGMYQRQQYTTAMPLLAERWGLKSEVMFRF